MKTEHNLLEKSKIELDKQIQRFISDFNKKESLRTYVDYSEYILSKIKKELLDLINDYGLEFDLNIVKTMIPPEHVKMDLAISVFEFCKIAKKSPSRLADELSEHINQSNNKKYITLAIPTDGYININLDREIVFKEIIESVLKLNERYGETDLYKNKAVVIDYSSPNIAKPFGIGHLRSTVIGQALANLYHAVGFSVIRDNHLGDWGTQFGALIYAYKHWGDEKKVIANPIEELKNLYVRFNEESKENPILKDEARKLFSRLENGDKELVEFWKRIRDVSLQEFQKTYDVLGVNFDLVIGESYYVQDFDWLIKDLEKKNIASVTEDGAVIVENLENLPTFLLQKNDGSTLYILRDIMTLIHRKKTFRPDVVLYVVGSEQKLNFQQLFALCNKADYSNGIHLCHIDFGLVLVNGEKMATRKGTLVNLDYVLRQITKKAKEILIQKGDINTVDDIDKTAEMIGTSAVIYADLKQNRNSDIEFDWKKMLSLESGSSVYLQYTYARIMSILTRAGYDQSTMANKGGCIFEDPVEFRLAFRLAFFPDVILRAVENNTPHLISIFLEELTANFNNFYSQISILKTENVNLRHSRLMLINAIAVTIKNALTMLNILVISKI